MPKKLSKAASAPQPNNNNYSVQSPTDDHTAQHHTNKPQQQQQQQQQHNYPAFFTDGRPLPRLIVFDLDYTLWPFWVDTHVSAPIKPTPSSSTSASASATTPTSPSFPAAAASNGSNSATDKFGEQFAFYADVPRILSLLSAPTSGFKIGVASRTCTPELARDMLRILTIPPPGEGGGGGGESAASSKRLCKPRRAFEIFDAGLEIYPSTKLRHMENLHRRTGIPYEDMLFFDDESRNREVEGLGVTMCLVRDGVSWGEMERGVKEWRGRRAGRR